MAAKRELIEPTKGDKRFVRRSAGGQFKEVDDLNRSLSADRRRKARTSVGPGQGDRGDRASTAARKGTGAKAAAGSKKMTGTGAAKKKTGAGAGAKKRKTATAAKKKTGAGAKRKSGTAATRKSKR